MNQENPYRSLYAYAWDIQDIGVKNFIDEMLAMGIHDVTLATSYHAGKFIRPHAKNPPCVIFPEDGVVYFEPQLSTEKKQPYGEIKPLAHSDTAIRAVLPELIADGRVRVHAWTVLMHNTRVGTAYPQYCTKNAFGDAYVYSLCPMQSAVFDYAIALCSDLGSQYPITSMVLETPGWLPYAHGYHHEFAQVANNALLDNLLGLCFCDACQAAAKETGIAIDALQHRVQEAITQTLTQATDPDVDCDAAWRQSDFVSDPNFLSFTKMRQARVTQLVQAISRVLPASTKLAVIPTVQRPTSACWVEGSDLAALAEVADYIEIPFYETNAIRAIEDAQESLRQIGDAGKVRAILRPGFPDLNNGAEIGAAIAGITALGINDFAFYNYGLLPQHRLDLLAMTLNERFKHNTQNKDNQNGS